METKKSLKMQNTSEIKTDISFPIVGIGASAGGLDPIRKLLENLPVDTGMAFVVIQHLSTGQESMLPEILSRSTKMKVLQVDDGMQVQKDQVYVIPPGTTMTLKNGFLNLVPKGAALKPINDFFISIAPELKTQAIGVVLSGTGNDGTEGLKAIKAEGGITFAQEPATAQYPDMPKNAIAAETPDFILPSEMIAKEIMRIAQHPQIIPSETKKQEPEKVDSNLKKIMMLLRTSFGVDFTHYKESTINRRITRRMIINKTKNMKEYIDYLHTNPNEPQALFDDLLIGVTSFFREPKTYEDLKEKVFPELTKNRTTRETIRVWVPGCSTGEEVYSVAITIQEFLEEESMPEIRIQIFGTDANEKNIEKARQGIYPKTIDNNVSENRLKRYFNRQNGNYQITKLIRDMCIFAKQNITSDPPFSKLDLIMCRNVLIYFDSVLHERVFPIFHYGLKPNGFLVLGESESIGKFQNLFEAITSKGVIYRRKQASSQILLNESFDPQAAAKKTIKPLEKAGLLTVLEEKVDHLITSEYGPATLLVNNNLDILVFRGDVSPYLMPESGAASFNITKIIRKELRSQVQTALYRAKKENKAFKETMGFKQKGQPKTISMEIRPLETPQYDEPFYLVLLTETSSNVRHSTHQVEAPLSPDEAESLKDRQIHELREDLEAAKQSLQTLVEGQEATNEELRSSMEEVQSSNEELQSTNEELETAKEELQSGNEELQTLNEELKNRNQALGRLNDDLANLQTNLDIAVVIVDSGLRIRRFTAAAQELLRISPSDVGGSIDNITPGVHIEDLSKLINDVIDKLTPVTQEVEGLESSYYEMRIRPYLTEDKKIDGAFLSFSDITKRKKAERALDKYAKNLETLVEERTSQLKDSERLAAIGATAGMVGHDIRNPLQAMTSDIYLAKSELDSIPGGEAKEGISESLDSIEKNIEYVNKIVQDLQDFAKPIAPISKETDIEEVFDDVLVLKAIPQDIKVTRKVEAGIKIFADPVLLKRILANLINNAVQSMPKGGDLGVKAFREGNDLVITVEDSGVGIPENVRPKLFTPLFTTKSRGQGFGLAIVKRITEALGGIVSFESESDKGTKFILRFPQRKN